MAQEFNTVGKDILNEQITDLASFVLDTPQVEVLSDVATEQQIVRAFRTDFTKHIRLNEQEAILHIELQLRDSTEKPMWFRNAQYQGYLVGEYQKPVYSNVIYIDPNAGKNDPGHYTYSWGDYNYHISYKVIRLIQVEGQSIIEAQMPRLLPFTPLMKPPDGMSSEQWVERCIEATTAISTDAPTKANLLYGLSIFGGLVHEPSLFEKIPEALMQESPFLQRQREKFGKEGREVGRKEGREEGRQQGEKAATCRNLIAVLNAKFNVDIGRVLTLALEDIDDLQRLEQLLLNAVKANSIEDFTKTLNV